MRTIQHTSLLRVNSGIIGYLYVNSLVRLCLLFNGRLYEELKQFYSLDLEVPSSDRNLVIDLPSWLKIAGKRSKVMLVLDALNQLDSGAGGSGKE